MEKSLADADCKSEASKKIASVQSVCQNVVPESSHGDKKKQPRFLEREIKIRNPGDVDHSVLLESLLKRFKSGFKAWKHQAKVFKLANLVVTLIVVMLQVTQVVLFQLPTVDNGIKHAMATILPALTGAFLAIQLKLSWAEKGAKCKKAAKLYKTLANHVEYRKQMNAAGGYMLDMDSVKMWNAALLSESKDIPAFLDCY